MKVFGNVPLDTIMRVSLSPGLEVSRGHFLQDLLVQGPIRDQLLQPGV